MNEEKRSICDAIFSAIQDDIRNLCDTEIFTQSTFMELGEFFYGKLINSVEGATVDLINTVVSVLNKNSNQAEQNEYYENLCQVLGFELLPKEAYDTVCSKFNGLDASVVPVKLRNISPHSPQMTICEKQWLQL